MTVDYTVRNRVGYLEVNLGRDSDEKDGGITIGHIEHGNWSLRFSDALPISFDVELGVGRGDFNMGGLQIKDFQSVHGCERSEPGFLRGEYPGD